MKQIIYIALLFSVCIFPGCKNEHENHQAESGSYYTCPMHTSVVSKTPGSCPICNMTLIKVKTTKSQHAGHPGNFVSFDANKQKLAGIKTDTVRFRNIAVVSTIMGTVAIDEEQVKTISCRVKGRIDKLFVKTTGNFLQKGSPLYSIYSEQLQADEKEYLALLNIPKTSGASSALADDILSASKNKLILWGLNEKQISQIETTKKINPTITFYSPESGYVSEMNITEGMYVEEGSTLLKVTSLSRVWIEAQQYSNEIASLAENKAFEISTESNPAEIYHGTLVYNNPVIEEGKRIYLLRISVNNSDGKLIPGMLVSVSPKSSGEEILAVPKSAVLLEKMKTVWVLSGENTFEQRMVETGAENKYWVEITSGLKQGDVIVTEGAYLVSSEFILKSGAGQRHDH